MTGTVVVVVGGGAVVVVTGTVVVVVGGAGRTVVVGPGEVVEGRMVVGVTGGRVVSVFEGPTRRADVASDEATVGDFFEDDKVGADRTPNSARSTPPAES